jgi:hypothetical protein
MKTIIQSDPVKSALIDDIDFVAQQMALAAVVVQDLKAQRIKACTF